MQVLVFIAFCVLTPDGELCFEPNPEISTWGDTVEACTAGLPVFEFTLRSLAGERGVSVTQFEAFCDEVPGKGPQHRAPRTGEPA